MSDVIQLSRREAMAMGLGVGATVALGSHAAIEPAQAQDATNYISGTVVDGDGNPVENAWVIAAKMNADGTVDNSVDLLATQTDATGYYEFAESDLYNNNNYYHVVARYGDDTDPWRSQENYPWIYASGSLPDSVDYQLVASSYTEGSSWVDEVSGASVSEIGGPTKQSGNLNGEDTILLDGVDDAFNDSNDEITESQPNATVLVARHISGTGVASGFFDGDTSRQLLRADNGSSQLKAYAGSNLEGGSTSTSWEIYNILFDGANSDIRVNGSTVTTGDVGSNSLAGLTIGANNQLDTFHEMEIAEMWFMGNPSTTDRDDADQELNSKYAIY